MQSVWQYGSIGYKDSENDTTCKYLTACVEGYVVEYDEASKKYKCEQQDLTCSIDNAQSAKVEKEGNVYVCKVVKCKDNYDKSSDGKSCTAHTNSYCTTLPEHASAGKQTWNGGDWGECIITGCDSTYSIDTANNKCVKTTIDCTISNATKATKTWNDVQHEYGACYVTTCATDYYKNSATSATECKYKTKVCDSLPAHATGGVFKWVEETYSYSTTCTVTGCQDGYHKNDQSTACEATEGED